MDIAVKVGDPFPVGLLDELSGDAVHLARGGRPAVVYFYPEDFTGTCTRQAHEFNRRAQEFADAGVELVGVSVDDDATHRAFVDEHGLRFPLVADPARTLSERLGIVKDYGEDGLLAQRVTFLVDGDGIIHAIWPVTDVAANADEALHAGRELARQVADGGRA